MGAQNMCTGTFYTYVYACGSQWSTLVVIPLELSSMAYFQESLWLCRPGRPETHDADQVGLQQRSTSSALGSKSCATTPSLATLLFETS